MCAFQIRLDLDLVFDMGGQAETSEPIAKTRVFKWYMYVYVICQMFLWQGLHFIQVIIDHAAVAAETR